jgi:circadian clock protein KaiB
MDSNDNQKWHLRLYVSGDTEKNRSSISSLKQICNKHLKGKSEIEVIDLMQNPQMAFEDNIIVTPSLLRKLPLPVRKIIGDLSDTEKVILGLEISV